MWFSIKSSSKRNCGRGVCRITRQSVNLFNHSYFPPSIICENAVWCLLTIDWFCWVHKPIQASSLRSATQLRSKFYFALRSWMLTNKKPKVWTYWSLKCFFDCKLCRSLKSCFFLHFFCQSSKSSCFCLFNTGHIQFISIFCQYRRVFYFGSSQDCIYSNLFNLWPIRKDCLFIFISF